MNRTGADDQFVVKGADTQGSTHQAAVLPVNGIPYQNSGRADIADAQGV
jgi:hypothetical protein